MKKILSLLSLIMVLQTGHISAQQRHDGHRNHDAYVMSERHRKPPYLVSNGNVFFEGHKIQGASAMGFELLRDGYAEDAWNTYYWGRKI